jgi:hypothetical protein
MGNPITRAIAGAALVFSCLTVAPTAFAGDATTAETLFQAGLEAMKKNDYAAACEAFDGSNKADASPGTQINLALCYEKQKKWASAWTWYRSAVGLAEQRGQAERAQLAKESAEKIKPQIHNIVISVKEPLTDLVVKRDGVEVTIAVAGKEVPLPVDPGDHTIEVSARGKKAWSKTVTVQDNPGTDRIDVPKLENGPVEEKPQGAAGGAEYRPPAGGGNEGSGQRTVGIIVGGAGILAGLASLGVYILANNEADKGLTLRKSAAADPDVESRKRQNQAAVSRYDAAENNQLISQILVGGAVVLIGVGTVLYFTAPKGGAPGPEKAGKLKPLPLLGPGLAGMGLGTTF